MTRFTVLAGLFAMATFQVVNADFIIWRFVGDNIPGNTYATSAGEMNCGALGNQNSYQTKFAWSDDTNEFGEYTRGPITQSSQSFHVTTGMCGAVQLDAYYDSDNNLWNLYNAGGGTNDVQGQCFTTSGAILNCPNLLDSYNADFVIQCNTYLCR
jgi:hypothetical protein